jgi:ParB family transcriptional regulator, chromosome partitioning protein
MSRSVQRIAIDKINWRYQVRKEHSEEAVDSRAATLKEVGQINPIVVRRVGDEFFGIDGQTRCLAAAKHGTKDILAIVDDADLGESGALLRALISNDGRTNLPPLDLANGIKRYMDLSGATASEAAERLGMTLSAVAKSLALLKLPEPIASQVGSAIGASVGYELSKVTDPEKQAELAAAAASGDATRDVIAAEVASQKKGRKQSKRKCATKATIALAGRRIVEVAARELSVDVAIECVEEALEKLRHVKAQGGGLDQLKRLCREDGKVSQAA